MVEPADHRGEDLSKKEKWHLVQGRVPRRVEELPTQEQRDAVRWQALNKLQEFVKTAKNKGKGNDWDPRRCAAERSFQQNEIMSSDTNIEAAVVAYRASTDYDAKRYEPGHGRHGGETEPLR
jgi:hypothetical protein